VDDSVYKNLLSRGQHTRIIEVISSTRSKVVGFYTIWPLSGVTYQKLKAGILSERNFKSSDILVSDDSDAEVLYIPEIGILQGGGAGPVLIRDALDYVRDILSKHSNFRCVAAWGYSDVGKSIATRLGFHPVGDPRSEAVFYEISAKKVLGYHGRRNFAPIREIAYF
jgi:hypothetical protein